MSTNPFGKLAVIAGAGEAGRGAGAAAGLERALAGRGLDYRLQVATSPADATRLASAALQEGYRYLAALGDDRTVQDVLNGMFLEGRTIVDRPVLAVLPGETGTSDLARSFGLPEDLAGAAGHLIGETTYPFDVMKVAVTGPGGQRLVRYAHNLGEVGLHAAAWRRASGLPAWLGAARRFLGFWSAYVSIRPRALRVGTDTKVSELRGWSVIVGNGQFADGGLRLSPRSFPGDGVLDALVFIGPKSDAYRLLPRVFRHGDHVPDPGITELRAKITVAIEADRALPVVVDGSYLGSTPVTFQLIPRPIELKL
jgi:diacylglycerol kinase family enzyme